MTDKIIFWLDAGLTHFGIANSMQKKYDAEYYAIIDVGNRPKKFFNAQDFVKFEKTWYYHEHIKKVNITIDLEYLKKFEEKYGINLWLLATNERIFLKFNEYYKFTNQEILSILEQECKFFEKVLDEINPDFLIMYASNFHYDYLFYEICKRKGIKPLLLNLSRIAYRLAISSKWGDIDFIKEPSTNTKRTLKELQEYLKGHSYLEEYVDYTNKFQKSKKEMLNALKNFIILENQNIKTHYTYFGRTKWNVISKSISYLLRKRYRKNWIDHNLIRNIDYEKPFIYFPLHMDEEATLLIGAPFYTNQIEIIKHIVKSLPIGYQLYIKEHHAQSFRGWRSLEEYKKILELPNVKLIHPEVNSNKILEKCKVVIAITSTSALEAAFYEKPSIIFGEVPFSRLSSVRRVENIEKLPHIIKELLNTKIDLVELNEYVNMIDANTFEFDISELELAYAHYFYHDGFSVDVEIDQLEMKKFLNEYSLKFDKLADEHIKKINQIKNTH